ncbi:hypothetical protein P3G55_11680, partial [Leptospira sp. 96542]|nr:hypothetical protein [Leptospira sp. 96542]
GKMSQLSPTSDVWLCVGKPHIFQRFSVGPNRNLGIGTKQVKGQVVEANGETGQIVYLERGRRIYLTIDPILAQEMEQRLGKMEVVEIDGEFRYDRIRHFYTKN